MQYLEYKLDMGPGGMHTPYWIDDGGYWHNPANKTRNFECCFGAPYMRLYSGVCGMLTAILERLGTSMMSGFCKGEQVIITTTTQRNVKYKRSYHINTEGEQ